jgi:hypothetical protein
MKNIAYATKGDPEDSDPKYADHLIDALRYLLINVGNEPKWHFEVSDDPRNLRQGLPAKVIEGYAVVPDGGDPWSLYVY